MDDQTQLIMESEKYSVINKASSTNSSFGVSQFKNKFYRRHANSGLGVGRIPVIKVDKKNEPLPSTNRCRKKFVLPEHIEEVTKDPPLYRCTICKRSFKEKLHSKYHEHCLTGKKPLICGVCDKGFITKSHLDYHLRTHTDTKPFECRYCQKKFSQNDKLKRHIRLTHFKERPHACTLCTKTFTSKQALQVHMNGHLRQRPFKCDLCMRSFSSNTVLQRHRLTHSAIRRFSCDACDKKFTLKSDLTIHQRVHSGIRPYQCTVEGCNKSFTLKTSYTRHLQTHSEIQDYECTICVLAFRRKDNLERHIRNFHPETMVEGRSQQIVSIVQPKNFLPRKSVSKGSSKKTIELVENLDLSLENMESGTDCSEVDKNRVNCDYREVYDSDLVRSRVEEYQECSSRLEPMSSRSVIVETVQKTEKLLSSEGASVISDSSKEYKLKPIENNVRKSSESILPYRTITPPAKLSENDRVNCVPTITKVTHIVHTTKTGIPNIETVITTRDVTKNKAKQSKEDERNESMTVEKPNRSKSVIRYVPKSTVKTSKRSVECFRVLKPSSDFVTTCSNLGSGVPSFSPATLSGGPSFDVFSARKQQMYNQGGSFANAFENLCQEILSEDTSRGATPSNNQKSRTESSEFNRVFLQRFNEPHNSKYYENNSETSRFPSNNCLQSYNNSGMVSDSCLLADNALDHSITDNLYQQQLNDNYSLHQMQNMEDNTASNNYIPHSNTCFESEQYYKYLNPNYSNYYYQSTDNDFDSFPVNERPRVSNFVQENNMNRLEGDTMNSLEDDHMNRLEDLRMDYRRFEDACNRSNNVSSVARSVIVDQPKPPIIPANYGPRQVPLKKCLWTKSAFGNLLNDSSCTGVS